jgi:acyl-CoA synthetase (NDP forming)
MRPDTTTHIPIAEQPRKNRLSRTTRLDGSFGELTPLLAPSSVAVIGASDREGNLGRTAVNFLKKFGFPGSIWPVNSGRTFVADLPCFASVKELPSTPDLAILAVPAESMLEVVKECIAAGVPAAVVWAGGFAEQGETGRARQAELEAVCRAVGLRLCGPNCIGIINTSIGLTASFSSMLFRWCCRESSHPRFRTR